MSPLPYQKGEKMKKISKNHLWWLVNSKNKMKKISKDHYQLEVGARPSTSIKVEVVFREGIGGFCGGWHLSIGDQAVDVFPSRKAAFQYAVRVWVEGLKKDE